MNRPRLTVVLPTLDEADQLPRTLDAVASAAGVEVLVVDGGSGDATVELARRRGARVLRAPRGRAAQLNVGAAAARGGSLLFLHADSRLPSGFDAEIERLLAQRDVVAGAFRLHIDAPGAALRIIEAVANLRADHLHLPYGDQALFVRREVFESAGGFPELPIMEDFELVRRLRRRGRIELSPLAVRSSARRWRSRGPWTTTLINQAVVTGYFLGVAPATLARWYDRDAPLGRPARLLIEAPPARD
jgi:rSAM/selenodomain-associated transferase 2